VQLSPLERLKTACERNHNTGNSRVAPVSKKKKKKKNGNNVAEPLSLRDVATYPVVYWLALSGGTKNNF